MIRTTTMLTRAALASLLLAGACGDDDDDGGSDGTIDGGDGPTIDADPNQPDGGQPDVMVPPACDPIEGTPDLALELVTGGVTDPVAAVVPPGDDRLFIVEKPGVISIVDGNQLLDTPFLDIQNVVNDGANERGLLGLAFHPTYATSKRFFVYYTNSGGDITLAEYTATSADSADPESEVPLLTIEHSMYSNHNGGWIAFGPDGYLYMGTGDGGLGGDPFGAGQDKEQLLGKILRLNVDTAGAYSSPPTNPFVGGAGKDEIWAYGVRNPWRNTFDRATGDLYIADVGQDEVEEVNVQPADSEGGLNYGWSIMEGDQCYEAGSCAMNGLTLPVYTYDHNFPGEPNPTQASITGGVVYRGCKMPGLHGTYFFSDVVHGFTRSFKWDGAGGVTALTDYPDFEADSKTIYGYGEDKDGEIIVLDGGDGQVYRIVPAN